MIDPHESTWAVEPFSRDAWLRFSAKDRFLTFQQRDMAARVETAVAARPDLSREELTTAYLEAQFNECHEDSVLARRWNRFAKANA